MTENLSETEKRKKMFEQQFFAARAVHDLWRTRWMELDEAYHGVKDFPKNTLETLRSRLRIPWIWQQIETIKPRIIDPDPVFEFQPVENRDIDYAQALNALTRAQLYADRFIMKQSYWAEDGLVKGLAIAKVIWLQQKVRMKQRRKQNLLDIVGSTFGFETETVEEREVISVNRPTIIYVDPNDFMWDPAATNDSNWSYVFHRTWLSKAELKQREAQGLYKDIDKIGSGDDSTDSDRGVFESAEEAKAKRSGKFAVWERWSRDGTVMTMCNGVVLRDEPNPYFHNDIPFAVFRSQPTPRSLVGVSEVEKIQHIQEAIWTRDNQRIDAVSLALNQVLIVDPSIQGARNITFQPGAKIYANGGQRIEQLKLDPMQVPGFEETQNYLGAMQQMTGASPYLAGSDPSMSGIEQNTATGVSIMQEEGQKRMMVKKLEFRMFESRIAKLMTQLNHQYLSKFEIDQLLGDRAGDFVDLSPEDIPMFLDVIPKGADEAMSISTKRQENIELLNVLGGLNGAQFPDGTTFTIKPFVQETLESFGKSPVSSFQPIPPMPVEPGMSNMSTMENEAGGMQGGTTI